MIDRENVIKALECRKNADKRCGNPCENTGLCHYSTAIRGLDGEIYKPFICDRERICADVLAVLKEQESVIETLKSDLNETLEVLAQRPEIVLCKDCAFRNEINCLQYYRRSELPDDWFCADGERKD